MWLFNKPPVRQLEEKHGFKVTPEWLEHLQKSSVRFGNGGSGSFVSANGPSVVTVRPSAEDMQQIAVQAGALASQLASR